MAIETIVAVFETGDQAQNAAVALERAGVSPNDIERHSSEREKPAGQANGESGPRGTGFFFWDLMLGLPSGHQDRSDYERSFQRGKTVLAVRVAEVDAEAVMSILERQSPLEVNEETEEAGSTEIGAAEQKQEQAYEKEAPRARSARPKSAETVESEEVIPLAEESLHVGKRTVNRGTTRIRRYVVETPVEKTVSLRDERVTVERRRPVTDEVAGDALTEKTVEVTETSEVPETQKVARLKEEVVVRKEGREREQTVQDTVRRDQIAVEDATEAPRRQKVR